MPKKYPARYRRKTRYWLVAVLLLSLCFVLFWFVQPNTPKVDKVETRISNGEILSPIKTEHWTKEILRPGTGPKPERGDRISIHYTGTLLDGTVFDSSRDREPFETWIGVGKLIRGWDEAVIQMNVGERSKLTIQPEYAYGNRQLPGIPANSVLVFDVLLFTLG
ncbi:peptidyl-prolyl cis-trans isomerase [Gorgonomyces haynaldii]|nr:peptidyl-prolyl cis-trans isomerase [Gorgonomyces haynaldii]